MVATATRLKGSRGFFSLICSSALLLVANSARAQDKPLRFEVFVQGGVSFNTSATTRAFTFSPPSPPQLAFVRKDSYSTAGRFFGGLRYYVTRNNAIEASYSYSPAHVRNVTTIVPLSLVAVFSSPARIHNVAFNYVRYLPGRSRLEPFVTGGLGLTGIDTAFGDAHKFAGNFGGGVDVRLHRRVRIRAEFRDFVAKRLTVFGFRGVNHNLVPSVGLAFKF